MAKISTINWPKYRWSYEKDLKNTSALILALKQKKSTRIKDKAKAQEFLENILEEEIFPFWYQELVLINLCDLLLDEYKLFNDHEVLVDLNKTLTKIQMKAEEQNSNKLIVEALIIQSKLAFVEGSMSNSEISLQKAKTIAVEKKLSILENKVNQ